MSKTQLVILWGMGIVVVVVLATLGILVSRAGRSQPPAALPSPTGPSPASPTPAQADAYRLPETPYTAKNLYAQAQEAASLWQPDAALVSAAASWPFVAVDDFSEPTDWTFQFYSAATQHAYVVNVAEQTVTPIRETLLPYSQPTIAAQEWQVDSYQALNAWLNRGGGAFLQRYPVVDVSIRLARTEDTGAVWTIVGLDQAGQAAQTEYVDASGSLP
jgi:hypothetical protein